MRDRYRRHPCDGRHTAITPIATAWCVLPILVAACGGAEVGAGGLPGPVVRDSAGVRMVESRGAPGGGWHAASEPLFTLGWAPDDPTFTWIQAGRILPDGGAVIGDYGSGMLYRLGPNGSVSATWGRNGEGPGEYQSFAGIIQRGDSIVVSDGRLRRLTLLSADGDVLATRQLLGDFLHQVSSVLPDGRFLLVPGEGYSAVDEMRPEWVFETRPVLAADLESDGADTLAVLPHLRRWYGVRGGTPGYIAMKGRAGGFDGGFAFARADRAEVGWYDGSGKLVQLARWDEDPVPLTAERKALMIQAYDELYRSQGADEAVIADRLARLTDGLDIYEGDLPYWDAFYVDRGGNVWLREFPLIPVEPSSTWRVVSRDGVFVGRVELPEVVAILDVTEYRVLAVRLDELDVPAAVMFELVKP